MKNPKGNKTALKRATQREGKLRIEVAKLIPMGIPPTDKKMQKKLIYKRTLLDQAQLFVSQLKTHSNK